MCLIASDRRLPLGIYQGHWRPLHCLLEPVLPVHACLPVAPVLSFTPAAAIRSYPVSLLPNPPSQDCTPGMSSASICTIAETAVWTSSALLAAWTFEPSKPRCSPPTVSLPADIIHTSAAFASHRPFSGLLLGRAKSAQLLQLYTAPSARPIVTFPLPRHAPVEVVGSAPIAYSPQQRHMLLVKEGR